MNFKTLQKAMALKFQQISHIFDVFKVESNRYKLAIVVDICIIILLLSNGMEKSVKNIAQTLLSPLAGNTQTVLKDKHQKQVFGFAPFWTINKLDNVDFSVLTTFAYFGIPVMADGNLEQDYGYEVFHSDKASQIFAKAHSHGTRVVLTITQMNSDTITAILDNPQAQERAINQTVKLVTDRGIDGVNIDFEYGGNPGYSYREKFTSFVTAFTNKMHAANPNSTVTVSVYASSAKDSKLYDIAKIAQNSDAIFMMAYDFAVAGSDNAIPTSPLYGHKEGKYWYDIATAVDDFLKVMPEEKLILGLPWYGYDYLVYEPTVKAETLPSYTWRGQPRVQTYASAAEDINPNMDGILAYKTGWDNNGEVGYKAYYVAETDTWRMVFVEDVKSLGIKYDFAKSKNLGGVGMWALGFDNGTTEMWTLLKDKFGTKLADARIK